jgi:hypothetical protein
MDVLNHHAVVVVLPLTGTICGMNWIDVPLRGGVVMDVVLLDELDVA